MNWVNIKNQNTFCFVISSPATHFAQNTLSETKILSETISIPVHSTWESPPTGWKPHVGDGRVSGNLLSTRQRFWLLQINVKIKLSDTLKRHTSLTKPSSGILRSLLIKKAENNTRYFKLPFIGQYSRITELKLRQLLNTFCETDLNVKLVFTSFKIKNMFSFKNRTPDALKSMVVYQFTCRDVIPGRVLPYIRYIAGFHVT